MPFMCNIEPAGNRAINQCKIMHVHSNIFCLAFAQGCFAFKKEQQQ